MKQITDYVAEMNELTQELATLTVGHSHMNKVQAEIRRLIIESQECKRDQFNSAAPCWRA